MIHLSWAEETQEGSAKEESGQVNSVSHSNQTLVWVQVRPHLGKQGHHMIASRHNLTWCCFPPTLNSCSVCASAEAGSAGPAPSARFSVHWPVRRKGCVCGWGGWLIHTHTHISGRKYRGANSGTWMSGWWAYLNLFTWDNAESWKVPWYGYFVVRGEKFVRKGETTGTREIRCWRKGRP